MADATMKRPVDLAVLGAAGRMGQMVLRHIAATSGCRLVAVLDQAGREVSFGMGAVFTPDPEAAIDVAQCAIDFTAPEASVRHAETAAKLGRALVIGTTGFSPDQQAAIDVAAQHAPILQSANFSAGGVLLTALVERAAMALGPDYDIEIVEMHHRFKADAPSGTALELGRAAARGRGGPLSEFRTPARDGETTTRRVGAIGFASLRGGDVVGDHTVMLAGNGERIELTHRASSREIFAAGAVRAALWLADRPNGRYDMRNVLGLKP